MATLPTVPTFVDGDTSITKLQQISDAVSFLSDITTRPYFKVYKTASVSLTINTWTTISFGTVDYDNDGFNSGSGPFAPVINTQGYYRFEGCVPLLTGATAISQRIAFLLTAGSNNPNLTVGSTLRFGLRGGNSVSTASNDTTQCSSEISPIGLYNGDSVALQVYVDTTVSTGFNANNSYISGRSILYFSGYWMRSAP